MNRTEHLKRIKRTRRMKLLINGLLVFMLLVLVFGTIDLMSKETELSDSVTIQAERENTNKDNDLNLNQTDIEQSIKDLETDTVIPENNDKTITLSFAGDTMAAGKVAPFLVEHGYTYPWEQAKDFLSEADLAMINLETAVSLKAGNPAEKEYAFLSHPDLLKGAKWAGVDLVSVANNHTLDHDQEAFMDTLHHLWENELNYVGGGANAQEAYQRKEIQVKGKTISFLAFSRVLPSVTWYAGDNKPGLASGYQEERVYKLILEAAEESDVTIVYMHWGKELANEPEQKDREMAHKMVDAGADVIIGSHSHVLQGLEYYQGKLIAYSLGNFIFTKSHQETGRQSGVLQVAIAEDGSQTASFVPMLIDKGAVWPASADMRSSILERLSLLSINGRWEDDTFYQE